MKVPQAAEMLIRKRAQDALRDGSLQQWIGAAADMYALNSGKLLFYNSMESDDDFLGKSIDQLVDDLREIKFDDRDVAAIVKMYSALEQLDEQPDHFKIALKRIRHGRESQYDWGVLAIAPRDANFYGTLLSDIAGSYIQFYKPQQQCSKHECDTLFKALRKEDTSPNTEVTPTMHLRQVTPQEVALLTNGEGVSHFRDPVSGQLADPKPLIAATIQGHYGNEKYRVSIPRVFFKK